MLIPGQAFPQFDVSACVGLDLKTGFQKINNSTYKGKWVIYFFYPKNFTSVCPTELVEFGKRIKDFADRDAVLVTGSTDNEFSHQAWRRTHADLKNLPYAMIAAQKLAWDLGIYHPTENVCLRATFIVDPNGIIQWSSAYPLSVGRSVDEVLRVLDAIQSGEFCPCNWQPGQETLKG